MYDLLVRDRKKKEHALSPSFLQKRNFYIQSTIKLDWRTKQGDGVEIKKNLKLRDMI